MSFIDLEQKIRRLESYKTSFNNEYDGKSNSACNYNPRTRKYIIPALVLASIIGVSSLGFVPYMCSKESVAYNSTAVTRDIVKPKKNESYKKKLLSKNIIMHVEAQKRLFQKNYDNILAIINNAKTDVKYDDAVDKLGKLENQMKLFMSSDAYKRYKVMKDD